MQSILLNYWWRIKRISRLLNFHSAEKRPLNGCGFSSKLAIFNFELDHVVLLCFAYSWQIFFVQEGTERTKAIHLRIFVPDSPDFPWYAQICSPLSTFFFRQRYVQRHVLNEEIKIVHIYTYFLNIFIAINKSMKFRWQY